MKRTILAATLAVGTEVTDGQIIDRNSAWISQKVTEAGFKVIEHRAVADDRADIERALSELSERVDYLFVTGGLGPTSDDFTRDLIATVFKRPLAFDQGSWQHLSDLLTSRGIEVREIQKQQCYFPTGAKVLTNPAGTANAFEITDARVSAGQPVHLIALPGPPAEIAAVWELNLEQRFSALVDKNDREELLIIRCLGRGESQIAEVVEDVIKGHGLKVGYRAHLPYVEVKLWYPVGEKVQVRPVIEEVEKRLSAWIVNHDDEDLLDGLLSKSRTEKVMLIDAASGGVFAERITQKINALKNAGESKLVVQTVFGGAQPAPASEGLQILLEALEAENKWRITVQKASGLKTELVESPPFHYKVGSDRGRKYIVEKALQKLTEIL